MLSRIKNVFEKNYEKTRNFQTYEYKYLAQK